MSAFLLAAGGRIDVGGRIGGLDWIVVGGLMESLARPVCSARLYPLVSFLASNWKNHTLRVTDRLTGRIVSAYIFCLGPVLGSMVIPFSRPETKPFLAVLALPQPQSRYVIAGKKNPNHFSFGFFEWTYQKVQGFAHFLLSVLWSTRTLLLVFILR